MPDFNHMKTTKVMVLGATGMLGSAVAKYFDSADDVSLNVVVRNAAKLDNISLSSDVAIHRLSDLTNFEEAHQIIAAANPQVVINCVGLVKQLPNAENPIDAISINSFFPHKMADICTKVGARFIHISTDCVFSGAKGDYHEDDVCDAKDFYGRSKLLGEVAYGNAVTLRTSIIGHELDSHHSLLEWFLQTKGVVNGFTNAIFSGLPTNELARVIHQFVLTNADLQGLFHVSAAPISKYDLLQSIARTYHHDVGLVRSGDLVIDRSLNSSRFKSVTGYQPASWDDLISEMKCFHTGT